MGVLIVINILVKLRVNYASELDRVKVIVRNALSYRFSLHVITESENCGTMNDAMLLERLFAPLGLKSTWSFF